MARKYFRQFESGDLAHRTAWALTHENMGIVRNSSFLAAKRKQMRNNHGGAVTMVT